MKKLIILALLSALGGSPAFAQTEPFATYVLGLGVMSSLTGVEKIVGVQAGTVLSVTPYQILGKVTGDCTIASPPSIVCTKVNGVSLAASATTDTTNASNITSGTLNLSRLALASASVYVGNGSNIPAAAVISGDCTITNTGVITCLKVNNVPFVASATTDTTNATNIGSGTLAGARYAAVNLAAGNVNGGVTGALPFANMPTGSLDTNLGYWGSTTLSATAIPNCSTGALQYSTTTHLWSCNVGGGSGSVTSVTCGTGLSGGTFTTTGTCAVNLTTATNVLGADVALNNTTLYFDGPSMAQGTTGTWWASGQVTVSDASGAFTFWCKLWDGTTVISSANVTTGSAGFSLNVALSGFIASPAANIRISCREPTSTSGKIIFNSTGNSKDSSVFGYRIQ
jgi:hypothetical protein